MSECRVVNVQAVGLEGCKAQVRLQRPNQPIRPVASVFCQKSSPQVYLQQSLASDSFPLLCYDQLWQRFAEQKSNNLADNKG